MKNKVFVFLLLSIFIFIQSILKVDAANICTQTIYNELKRDAYKVSLSWELKFDEKNNGYFEVTVSNMNSNILLVFAGMTYEIEEQNETFKINSPLLGGKTYEFEFYGGYNSPCTEEYIYTKYLTLPNYNSYSELEECIEYEEFPLCNKWYDGVIESKEYFYSKLEEYIESLKSEDNPEKPKTEEKNIFEKIIDFYFENIIITLPTTILFLVFIIIINILKVKKAKQRIKIDI